MRRGSAGVATRGAYSAPPENRVVRRVVDNGDGRTGVRDQISDQWVGAAAWLAPWYCASAYEGPDLHDIEAGNIKVSE